MKLSMTRITKRLVFIAISCVPAGCAGVTDGLFDSKQAPGRVYWLEPLLLESVKVDTATSPDMQSLSVSVSAAPGLDTNRILILESDARLNYYASARWPDNSTEVFESLLRSTLESTGRYSRVTRGTSPYASNMKLDLEIRELYTVSNNSVRMLMQGYLECGDHEQAITLNADVGIDDNRLSEIVAAYQETVDNVSQQVVEQTATSCNVSH